MVARARPSSGCAERRRVTDDLVPHAVLSFKLGALGQAERIARDALKTARVDSSLGLGVAHCILGISLYYQGEPEEASTSLEEAVRLSVAGDNRLARIYALGYLALIRFEAGDEDAARIAAGEALGLGAAPPASEHFVTADALVARGRLDRDEGVLEHAVALCPARWRAHRDRGLAARSRRGAARRGDTRRGAGDTRRGARIPAVSPA